MHHVFISLNTNSPHFLNEHRQALVLCAKQSLIQFRIVFSRYLQNLKGRQLPETELSDNFQKLLALNGKLLLWTRCLWTFCVVTTNDLYIMENRPNFRVIKNNQLFPIVSFCPRAYNWPGNLAFRTTGKEDTHLKLTAILL